MAEPGQPTPAPAEFEGLDARVSADNISAETNAAIDEAMAAFAEDAEETIQPEATGDTGPVGDPPPAEAAADASVPTPEETPEGSDQSQQPDQQQFVEAWQRLEQQAQSVNEREQALRAVESRVKGLDEATSQYRTDRVAAVKRLVGAFLDTQDAKAIDAEVQSLYETLTSHILGVESGSKAPSESTQLRRDFEALKRQHAEDKAASEKQAQEAAQAEQVEAATEQCDEYVQEHKETYPALALGAEALGRSPGEVLFAWATDAQERGETNATLSSVASQANEWYLNLAKSLSPLLASTEASEAPTPQQRTTPKPRPGATTLTTTRTADLPAPKPKEYNPDPEAAREDAWAMFQKLSK